MRIAEVPPPSPSWGPGRVRAGGCSSTASRSWCGWRWSRTQLRTRAPTARFQRGAFPVGQPSIEERGEFESHAVRRALVSSEARLPGRFTLHACAGRDSNPHVRRHTVLGRARLPVLRHQRERASPPKRLQTIAVGGLLPNHWSVRAGRSPLTHPRHFQPVSTR
jgi:hypothetical protein